MKPHEEFLELCALSASGELSAEERRRLDAHVALCSECRQALKEFEAVVEIGVPLLAPELAGRPTESVQAVLTGNAGADNNDAARGCVLQDTLGRGQVAQASTPKETFAEGLAPHASRNGNRHTRPNWSLAWLSLAAGILLTVALGIYAYRIGKGRGLETLGATTSSADSKITVLEQQISETDHKRELLEVQLYQRDQQISGLQRQVQVQSALLDEMKTAQAKLEQSIGDNQAAKQQLAEENSNLAQKLGVAETSLGKIASQLDTARQKQLSDQIQVAGLESQVGDMTGQLRERERTIDRQDALLGHDRDIRELMGARDLYIAEVYDVDRDGKTKKPFGRVFYTKGKSLVFYAYDLDQQAGAKSASTFQAWGQRGADEQQALNLGIFYQDNAAKKRWVLKFDNPEELAEINAVFVTVEPGGGSSKPSGKPLLFAYLKIQPNHP